MMLIKTYVTSLKSLILFFLFSITSCLPQEDSESTIISSDICNDSYRNDSITLTSGLVPFRDLMTDQTGALVLEDGSGALIARAWLSEYAEKTIDIQYFIFSLDNIGLIASEYLVRAANRGVKVRIVVDDIMVKADIEDILVFASHPNISVKIYNPGVNLGKNIYDKLKKFTLDFRGANQRMHNKTFIVDGKAVITGGRNIADEYFDYDHDYNFRDRDILLLGKGSKQVQSSFEEFWESSLSHDIKDLMDMNNSNNYESDNFNNLHDYACDPQNLWPEIRVRINSFPDFLIQENRSHNLVWLSNIEFISDQPGKNNVTSGLTGGGATTSALIRLIDEAKSSIEIQTPYLITTDLGKSIFKAATDRGVEVRILTNSLASTDNVEAFSSYQSDRENLLDAGIKIFEFRPDASVMKTLLTGELHDSSVNHSLFGLHAKTMIIDNEVTVIGTFNLDPRSANLNTECIVVIRSAELARGVLTGIEKEFQPENSWQITRDFNPDNTVSRGKRVKTWTRKLIPKEIL